MFSLSLSLFFCGDRVTQNRDYLFIVALVITGIFHTIITVN
jgi:hypothetical protein